MRAEKYGILLSQFLKPTELNRILNNDKVWELVLGENIRGAIDTLQKEELIEECSIQEKIEKRLTGNELKSIATKLGVKQSGIKRDLINRIIETNKYNIPDNIKGMKILKCTDRGKLIAMEYIENRDIRRKEYGTKVLSLLENGNYKDAVLLASNYDELEYHLQIGSDTIIKQSAVTKLDKINDMFSNIPDVLNNLDMEVINCIRKKIAMEMFDAISIAYEIPENIKSNYIDTKKAIRLFVSYLQNRKMLRQCEREGVKKVEFIAASDSCDECAKMNGMKFLIKNAPQLPNPKCKCSFGCRCTYIYVI